MSQLQKSCLSKLDRIVLGASIGTTAIGIAIANNSSEIGKYMTKNSHEHAYISKADFREDIEKVSFYVGQGLAYGSAASLLLLACLNRKEYN